MFTRLSTAASLIACILLTACAPNTDSAQSKCASDYEHLRSESDSLKREGKYDEAQKYLQKNQSCFKSSDRYWALRASTFSPNEKLPPEKERKSYKKSLKYIDKAIQIAPGIDHYYVEKAIYLIGSNDLKAGIALFDKQLNDGNRRFDQKGNLKLADTLLIQTSSTYIWAAKKTFGMQYAEDHMSEYLIHACYDSSVMRKNLSDYLIAIGQVFDGVKQPHIPRNKDAKEKALNKSCASFQQQAH